MRLNRFADDVFRIDPSVDCRSRAACLGVWLIWYYRKSSDAPLPHAPWHESASAQSSKIDRYYQLHRQFCDYSLAALHAVVNEFKEA